jgi:hypothetical protein
MLYDRECKEGGGNVVNERPIEQLVEITDEHMRALPFGCTSLTPELEQRFADIAGPLSKEDWKRLHAFFVIRHMPEYTKEILSS